MSLVFNQRQHATAHRAKRYALRNLFQRLRLPSRLQPPAVGWQRKSRALVSSGLFGPLLSLISVMLLLGISSLVQVQLQHPALPYIQLALIILGITVIGMMFYRIHSQLMTPLAHMRNWAHRMSAGNLTARIPVRGGGEFAELARDINALGKALEKLSREMDAQVCKQTERIEHKNHSLEILYDVAASINTSRDLNDLLSRFLFTLQEVVHAKAAAVRLRTEDGNMRLVASLGLDDTIKSEESFISMDRCLCGRALRDGELLSLDNLSKCGEFAGKPFFDDENVEMIVVPLQYRSKTLGVYNLFIEKPGLLKLEDTRELLTSIGRHLGMAIEKARLDEASKRHSIIQERNMLSHELHDSLAQTLASLRYQVRMLDDSLKHHDNDSAQHEAMQIRNGLDEAYAELRELLAHFRAPFDERGLHSAIENVIERFRKESNILIFFQNQWDAPRLSPSLEMQILRIIQEALANIRKHSKANAVRVLLRQDEDGKHTVLIEDDGVGIGEPVLQGKPGEHIGLSIMQERAQRLGGTLSIDSELGEGTRILLSFSAQQPPQQDLLGFGV